MTDLQFGALVRAIRIRLRWRQSDLAQRAGVSQTIVSRIERGDLDTVPLATVRRVSAALDIRVDLIGRWRGADADRLLSARHSALGESVIRGLTRPGWIFAPEVSFSIFGERGVIDLLAWNRDANILLVIELKTQIVDVNELVGTFDRKVRLAGQIARDHGWALDDRTTISAWVIVADSRTNRRRVQDHAAMLRAAYPVDGRRVRSWLARPRGSIRCLSFWAPPQQAGGAAVKRVQGAAGGPPGLNRVRCRNVSIAGRGTLGVVLRATAVDSDGITEAQEQRCDGDGGSDESAGSSARSRSARCSDS